MASTRRNRASPSIDAAVKWLRDKVLANGPVRTVEIQEMAKERRFAWRSVQRAKHKLRFKTHKIGPIPSA